MTPKRILLIRRDNIGDLVCTTPLLHALRMRFPEARLDVLVNSYCAPVLHGHPDIDHLYIYTKTKHRATNESVLGVYWRRLRTLLALRAARYDVAVLANVSCLPRPIRWARHIGVRHIVGFSEPDSPLARFIDQPVSLPPLSAARHEVERLMDLMQPFGGIATTTPPLHLCAEPHATAHAQQQLAHHGHLVGLHISARKPSQRWPTDRFIALIHALHAQNPAVHFALFWSPGPSHAAHHPGDDDKAQAILAACRDLPLTPLPSQHLSELIGGLSLVDTLICSDGGAMHVAAALGKPIVCLFGDTEAAHWHPWAVPYVLLQADSRDVHDLSVEQVCQAYFSLTETAEQPL